LEFQHWNLDHDRQRSSDRHDAKRGWFDCTGNMQLTASLVVAVVVLVMGGSYCVVGRYVLGFQHVVHHVVSLAVVVFVRGLTVSLLVIITALGLIVKQESVLCSENTGTSLEGVLTGRIYTGYYLLVNNRLRFWMPMNIDVLKIATHSTFGQDLRKSFLICQIRSLQKMRRNWWRHRSIRASNSEFCY
jgi:hypothetical protein